MNKTPSVRRPRNAGRSASRDAALLALGSELGTLLTTARAFSAEVARRFDPALSNAAFQILQKLHGSGPMRAMRIAEALAMDRSALSRLLQQLLQADLVQAVADPVDGRAALYELTDAAGRKMASSMADKRGQFFARFDGWPESDLLMLSDLLRRLNASDAGA